MIFNFLVKPILLLGVGAILTVGVVIFITKRNVISPEKKYSRELGTSTSSNLTDYVQDKENKKVKALGDIISKKILPEIVNNPLLAPIVQTKQDIEKTIDSVSSLPQEQKNVICKQICTP